MAALYSSTGPAGFASVAPGGFRSSAGGSFVASRTLSSFDEVSSRRRLGPLCTSGVYFSHREPRAPPKIPNSPPEPPTSPRGLSPLFERPHPRRATERGSLAVSRLRHRQNSAEIPPRSFATVRNRSLRGAATGVASAGSLRARGRFGGRRGPWEAPGAPDFATANFREFAFHALG